jgi:predicted transcriptional regulator
MKTLVTKNIIALRETTGLKPSNIAAFLGITREVVLHYENGHQDIPINHLEKLVDLFRVDLYDLMQTDLTQNIPAPKLSLRPGKFSSDDLNNISRFNKIIKNYVKMNKLNNLDKIES